MNSTLLAVTTVWMTIWRLEPWGYPSLGQSKLEMSSGPRIVKTSLGIARQFAHVISIGRIPNDILNIVTVAINELQ